MNLQQTIEAARNVMRFRHMSYRTEQAYTHWITRYAHWCRDHAQGGHTDKVRGFLTHLAKDRNVSCSTQKQAMNAIVFLYKQVLNEETGDFIWAARQLPAKLDERLPRHQAAGQVSPYATVGTLSASLRPTLNPATFDALVAVWQYLDDLDKAAPAPPHAATATPAATHP